MLSPFNVIKEERNTNTQIGVCVMYTIHTINYKNTTKCGYVVLYLYVRCNETGEKFQVKGHSEVESTFFKPKKTVVRFDRKQIDSQNRLVRGLIVPINVTSTCVAKAMKTNGCDAATICEMKQHFCWDSIMSKQTSERMGIDLWFRIMPSVFPYMRGYNDTKLGQYCLNSKVIRLKSFLDKIGVHSFTPNDVYHIVNTTGFKNDKSFVDNLEMLFDIPEISDTKFEKLVSMIPLHMITPEMRRKLDIYIHIKKQQRGGSIYVHPPPKSLWTENNRFPETFYESPDTGNICLLKQRIHEKRFVEYLIELQAGSDSKAAGSDSEAAGDDSEAAENDIEKQIFNKAQTQAVENALTHHVSLVNGPPGTGKTYVTKGIVRGSHDAQFYFLAPTGKAVYRLKESMGNTNECHEFKTIHKLYYDTKRNDVKHSTEQPTVFVIDEASMLDYNHMVMLHSIWEKIVPDRIVFSGDTEQLPPIGVGDLFRDLLSSRGFPVTTLTERFRQQGADNALIDAIEDVENRRVPLRYDDSFRHVCATMGIANKVMGLLFPKYNYDDFCNGRVMVIASKNDSVDVLSSMIRRHLIPESKMSTTMGGNKKQKIVFYENDIVRCNENRYDDDFELLRGTPGVVGKRDADGCESTAVHYANMSPIPLQDHKVELNYATTCHKSQGSEAEHVIFVLEPQICAPLHKRNLLYTAMTRAKKTLTIVGPMDVVCHMVSHDPVKRLTTIEEHF